MAGHRWDTSFPILPCAHLPGHCALTPGCTLGAIVTCCGFPAGAGYPMAQGEGVIVALLQA